MNLHKISWKATALALSIGVGAFGFYLGSEGRAGEGDSEKITKMEPVTAPIEEVYPFTISKRSSFYLELRGKDVPASVIHEIVQAAKPVVNLGNLRPGTPFQLFYSTEPLPSLVGIKFKFSPIEKVEIKKVDDVWTANKVTLDVETKVVTFGGVVHSTLWESAAEAKMDPNLISDLSDIFAWQVDFSREVRPNDRWRLSVEQKLVNGKPYGWGSILAAEYKSADQLHKAILFQVNDKRLGYFAPDGSSLRRMFLKSPIQFARISSRFRHKRFHPILKINRPHLGVDYAAPRGTPIRAVGDGVIASAGRRGGAGNMIQIRHNSVYKTAYKHLSGYAKGIRSGARVKQGQIIGYVGSTGLSTGPHLHFEFFQNGRVIDPLGKNFPSADPIPAHYLSQFQTEAISLAGTLPPWESVQVLTREPASADSL